MATGWEIRVRGQVQGVGFRPFVWQVATRMGLRGTVLNDAQGVLIHVCGPELDAFLTALSAEAPPLARVDAIERREIALDPPPDFSIAASGPAGAETRVAPDAATCADCVAEIMGDGRRRGYAFTNCTNCGPRFTILNALPYDRAQTTMAPFTMCAECRAEYEDPADRRFHAQPIACPACGPRLALLPLAPAAAPVTDPLADAARRLMAGEVVAIKGLGGFHIACDATDPSAVAALRARKRRPTKPLALMGTPDMVRRYADVSPEAEARLSDPAAPILLLPRAPPSASAPLPTAIAPHSDELGWMLPYTPLHHLLLAAVGRPLVMTSGNLSGEPQVIDDAEAQERLGPLVDAILTHNRAIARRLDDSVERLTPHGPMVLRHARGRAPATLPLPPGFEGAPDVVAYGAHLKSALCLTKNGQALPSHHLGDLDDPLTWEEFVKADQDYAELFDHAPEAVACDLHPEYRSSRHAATRELPLVQVQHHHAHLAACLGENGWPREGGPVAGIVLDGLGLGADGTVWGGEVLVGGYADIRRAAWLTPVPLPGGDAASREPWRNLLARLDQAGLAAEADRLMGDRPLTPLRHAMAARLNAPLSSSAGRLFDAVAAALDLAPGRQCYEGEAAMALEACARRASGAGDTPYRFDGSDGAIDPAPLWPDLLSDRAAGVPLGAMAWRFHAGLAQAFAGAARTLVDQGAAEAVALSGGCFQNALLLDLMLDALDGLPVMIHRKVPANDGGIAFGQALVALARLESG